MKRFHVHVAVADLDQNIRFYAQLFASDPAVVKPGYAKWMLDDPRINFAVSRCGGKPGVNHLGLQVESGDQLEEIHGRLKEAAGAVLAESDVSCCYARSDKYWITDPQGIAWETFHNLGTVPFYGAADSGATASETTCCAPASSAVAISPPTTVATSCCGPATVNEDRSACR